MINNKYSVNTNNNIGGIIEFGFVIKASKFIDTNFLVLTIFNQGI